MGKIAKSGNDAGEIQTAGADYSQDALVGVSAKIGKGHAYGIKIWPTKLLAENNMDGVGAIGTIEKELVEADMLI